MKIQHENIFKVLDIPYTQFSRDFIGFIAKQQPTYKDRILEEDLFSPETISGDNEEIPEPIESELNQVDELMREHDCEYFRITYN